MDDDEVLDLDEGNAAVWATLEDGVKGKRTKLMHEIIGLTHFNRGLNCMMLDILTPYRLLMVRLQTQNRPVAHRVVPWIEEFFRSMNTKFLGDSPTWGTKYRAWCVANPDSANLRQMEKQVQTRGRQFVHVFLGT